MRRSFEKPPITLSSFKNGSAVVANYSGVQFHQTIWHYSSIELSALKFARSNTIETFTEGEDKATTSMRSKVTVSSRVSACLLLVALSAPPNAQAWQGGSPLRSKLLHQAKQHKRSKLFHSPEASRSRPLLLEKINGSGVNGTTMEKQRRRVRIRNRISNLWSSILHGKDSQSLHSTTVDSPPPTDEMLDELETENRLLRETIRQLELENDRLSSQQKIILETFEGEGRLRPRPTEKEMMADPSMSATGVDDMDLTNFGITLTGEELTADIPIASEEEAAAASALWCDDLDEDSCPVEPTVSFGSALRDRAYWLVGLLVMQSCSGLILSRNEALLANHPIIIYFLTMLVGAGGTYSGRRHSMFGSYAINANGLPLSQGMRVIKHLFEVRLQLLRASLC